MLTPAQLYAEVRRQWAPPVRYAPSEWAEAHRILPATSAGAGPWRNARAPYLVEIMDAVKERGVKEVWFMASSQVGKTEALLNLIGYYIAADAATMLMIQPTVDMAESFSKERLASMLRDSPALRGRVAEPRASGSENTILHKAFEGGNLDMVGANSPAGLASRPKRIIIADEVDRYDASAGAEGDPLMLAKKRMTTYHNCLLFAVSTPTISGVSRIEKGYLSGDQRRYFVPCPHCGELILLEWDNLDFSKRGTIPNPVYICPKCQGAIEEHNKPRMVANGKWVAQRKLRSIASFCINELYSPFSSWGAVVESFLSARKIGPHAIKVWRNTSLGLPYEETGEQLAVEKIQQNTVVTTEHRLPKESLLLTAGIDVQGDRLECEIVAWWEGDQSYSVDYLRLDGSPKESAVWQKLDDALAREYITEDGRAIKIVLAAVDSGDGNNTADVMAYASKRTRMVGGIPRGVIPVKGASKFDAAIWSKPHKRSDGQPMPWMLGVSQIKLRIHDFLKMDDPGPGFMRFPEGRETSYFEGLTAEKLVTRRDKRGFPTKEWHKSRERNEPIDCRAYAYACVRILNPNYDVIKERASAADTPKKTEENAEKPQIIRPRRPKMAIKLT